MPLKSCFASAGKPARLPFAMAGTMQLSKMLTNSFLPINLLNIPSLSAISGAGNNSYFDRHENQSWQPPIACPRPGEYLRDLAATAAQ